MYGIARVPRRPYFAIDRQQLAYLNTIEKAHCMYCSYVTGLLAYVREIGARTEQYWCPIRHARSIPTPHARYQLFFEYGDAEGYRRGLAGLRRTLREPPVAASSPDARRGMTGTARASCTRTSQACWGLVKAGGEARSQKLEA